MSLKIKSIESNIKDSPKSYCETCLSTDVSKGNIFD
jgi:hypothetical protein